MLIRVLTSVDEDDYRSRVEIDTPVGNLEFGDGEPEDNNLGRNFNDVYSIAQLIKDVVNHIDEGETIEIEEVEVPW